MHTYVKSNELTWTVGHYKFLGNGFVDWIPMRDFHSEVEAARYVSFLNGGSR